MIKAWEKRPDESLKAWEAFLIYREMGLQRSLTPVAKRLKKSVALLSRWSIKHNWPRRADEFDRANDAVRVQAHQQAIAKISARAAEKFEVSTQRTLLEVARLSYADIRNAVQWDAQGNVTFTPSDQLDDHTAAAIASFEVRTDKNGNPVKSLKFHNKLGALNLAGQKDGLWQAAKGEGTITNNYLTLIQTLKSESVDAALAKMPASMVVDVDGTHQRDPD